MLSIIVRTERKIKSQIKRSNNLSNQDSLDSNPELIQNDVTDIGRKIYEHLYYRLLNGNAIGGLFKYEELAKRADCTPRTVYTFLKDREARGEIKVQNKGRSGLLVTILKKGWELSKLFKTAFLAFFRHSGRIPYLYICNKDPSPSGTGIKFTLIEKMCRKAGLNESQTRAVKEKIGLLKNIKSLAGSITHFIKQVKEGVLEAVKSYAEKERDQKVRNELWSNAERAARAELAVKGITCPKSSGAVMTIEELDAFNSYHIIMQNKQQEIYKRVAAQRGVLK